MALTTKTIQDTINWAKRNSFNRNPVIGNSLEPALTSANIVLQTILSPPFDWWWNNLEIGFTCDPTATVATSTAVSISAGVVTVTATNSFVVGEPVFPSALAGGLTALNGQLLIIASANSSSFTTEPVSLPNGTDTTGTFTSLSTQDYAVAVPNFSHIEHASVMDLSASGTPLKWYELTVKNNLSLESSQNRPQFIGPHVEDASGNVTFRLASAPDKAYPVSLHVQLTAPPITSINQLWSPLPDFMQYIADKGFMALMWKFADDPRSAQENAEFKAAILARAEGLTEEERNIFLNNWDFLYQNPMAKQMGTQARGV
jgi:hypothetical protein